MRWTRWWVAALIVGSGLGVSIAEAQNVGGISASKRGDKYSRSDFTLDVAGGQAAIDYAGPGGRVQFQAGRFPATQTLRIPYSGIEIAGVADSTIFDNASATGDTIFAITGNNVTLRNFRIDGRVGTRTQGYGVVVAGQHAKLEGIQFVGMPLTAIRTTSSGSHFNITRCVINGVGNANGEDACGIGVQGTDGGTIHDNEIVGTFSPGIKFEQGAMNIDVTKNRINGTSATNSAGDGIRADSTNFKIQVRGNRIQFAKGDGIEMSADSSCVEGNLITSCTYGVHTHYGGLFITYKNNFIANTQIYGMYIELVSTGVWGLHILGNFVVNSGANSIHLESQITMSGDVVVEGNYFYGGVNAALSSVRVLSVSGGRWHGLKIRNNTIWGAKRSGIEFIVTGSGGYWEDCAVEDNIIDTPGQYGIETEATTVASEVYLSGNTVIDPGTAEFSLSPTNWTYEGKAKKTARASTVIAEDSLRVTKMFQLGTYVAASLPASPNGSAVYCSDCTKTTPCAGGGSGAVAYRVNGAWDCMAPGGGGSGDSTGLAYLPGRPNGQVLMGSSATSSSGATYLGLRGYNSASSALIKLNNTIDLTGVAAVSDTLRTAGNLDLSNGDIRMKNNRWLYGRASSGNTLSPILKADSANTVRLHTITGGNLDIFKTDGTLNTRFYGTGHASISGDLQLGGFVFLQDADPDRRIVSRNASGGFAFRPLANDRHNFYIKNGGAAWGAQSITAKDTLVAEGLLHAKTRALVVDSLRVNKKGIFDLGVNVLGDSWVKGRWHVGDSVRVAGAANFDAGIKATGTSWVSGLFSVKDSLRSNGPARFDAGVFSNASGWTAASEVVLDTLNVIGRLNVGSKSGIPNRHTIGTGGLTAADSLTVVFNGQSGVSTQYSPKFEFQRGGAAIATTSLNGTNFTNRIPPSGEGSKFFRWGTLNSETAGFIMTLDNSGRLEIGTGTPDKALEVTGAGSFTDSLRTNKGIYVGGQLVNKVLRFSGTLDFDLSGAATQDLTITATGAAVGDEVSLGIPNGSMTADTVFYAWVSATDTVTVRAIRVAGTPNPASGTFKVTVIQ